MKHAVSLWSGRRTVLAVRLALLVDLGLLVVAGLETPKEADAATRLVTKIFSNANSIAILEAAPDTNFGSSLALPFVAQLRPHPNAF